VTVSSNRKKKKRKTRKGVYLLPNLFTTGSLFAAFYSIIAASRGQWEEAAMAIFISAVLDGLDGKVARLTKSTSQFGVEYDSLADVVAFGAAPAFLVYKWALLDFGRLGWVAACLYLVCGALRLARFNVQSGIKDPRYYVGLPIPMAAVILAVVVFGAQKFKIHPDQAGIVVLVLLYLLSFLKVSTLPYRSLKEVALTPRRSFNFLVAGVLIFSLVAYRPVLMGLILLALYLSSGPAIYLWRLRATKKAETREGRREKLAEQTEGD
jgi:CDP-diacylglycerol---serine O-phosphatidyltransferase